MTCRFQRGWNPHDQACLQWQEEALGLEQANRHMVLELTWKRAVGRVLATLALLEVVYGATMMMSRSTSVHERNLAGCGAVEIDCYNPCIPTMCLNYAMD